MEWDTKGFQNIKFLCLYLNLMSCENFKCLHFAKGDHIPNVFILHQVKHIVESGPY